MTQTETKNLTNDSSSPQTQVDAQILNSGKISPATSISNPPQQLFALQDIVRKLQAQLDQQIELIQYQNQLVEELKVLRSQHDQRLIRRMDKLIETMQVM